MDVIRVLLVFTVIGHTSGWLFARVPKEICYGKLGCFSSEYPFTNTRRLLPRSPKVIGTRFFLATRNTTDNDYTELVVTDNHEKCSWTSLCEGERPTILLIHGYIQHLSVQWYTPMTQELLNNGDYNVIMVNWVPGSNEINYYQAAANIRVVGAEVAQLLKMLRDVYNIDPKNFHIIGHSLGAHVAGYAGEHMPGIGRITGLDPAGPAFEGTHPQVRLDKTDAIFVDAIHTDAEPLFNLGFGLVQPCGTVDFYPNGGKDQLGCPNSYIARLKKVMHANLDSLVSFACSHLRVLDYYIESINSQCEFQAYPCDTLNSVSSAQCTTCQTTGCAVMGFHTNTTLTSGKYVLKTKSKAPFCLS